MPDSAPLVKDAGEPKELHESRLDAALPVLDMHAYILATQEDQLAHWRTLQELAGLR